MFKELKAINRTPKPFEFYTAPDLWTDNYTSQKMLEFHLNKSLDIASRRHQFIEQSVDWIVKRFGISHSSKIADFGCGPGLYSNRLAQTGAEVTGIDFSPRSIAYAKEVAHKQQLKVNYLIQNYLGYEQKGKYDLIIIIMCDFCALSPEQRKLLLDKFRNMLKPGGCILLDVYSLAAFDRRKEEALYEKNLLDGFWSPHEYYGFLNTHKYNKEKIILDKYTIVEETQTKTIYNWLQYFSPDAIRKDFFEYGMKIIEICGDVAGSKYNPDSNEFAIIGSLNNTLSK